MDDLVLRDKSSERLFAMQDGSWNVVAIADSSSVVQERYAYSPYGVPVFLTPTFTSRASSSFTWQRLFTGQTYDTPTGLHYFRNRMLHSQVGTFITRDPIGYADGLHLYRAWFVMRGVDPLGTRFVACCTLFRTCYSMWGPYSEKKRFSTVCNMPNSPRAAAACCNSRATSKNQGGFPYCCDAWSSVNSENGICNDRLPNLIQTGECTQAIHDWLENRSKGTPDFDVWFSIDVCDKCFPPFLKDNCIRILQQPISIPKPSNTDDLLQELIFRLIELEINNMGDG